MCVAFLYKGRSLLIDFSLGVDAFFYDILLISSVLILFIQLGINRKPEIILKVLNQEVFIWGSNGITRQLASIFDRQPNSLLFPININWLSRFFFRCSSQRLATLLNYNIARFWTCLTKWRSICWFQLFLYIFVIKIRLVS